MAIRLELAGGSWLASPPVDDAPNGHSHLDAIGQKAEIERLREALADRADEISFLRQFIENVLIGKGFETWVRFHIALQDYSHKVREPDWRTRYLRAIAECAANEVRPNRPSDGVLMGLPIGQEDYLAKSRRRRPCS